MGIMIKNKLIHRRTIGKRYGTSNIEWLKNNVDENAKIINGEYKYKYVMPIVKNMIPICKSLSKPYPKKEV